MTSDMSTVAEESADTAGLEHILSSIDVSPRTFFQPSASLQAASLVAAKRILDPIVNEYSVFRDLALKGLDVEQVWEQVKVVGDKVAALVDKQGEVRGVKSNGVQNRDRGEESGQDESMMEEEDTDPENVSNNSEEALEDEDDDGNEIDEEQEEDESEEDDGDEEENNAEPLNYDEFPENPEADSESSEEIDMSAELLSKPLKKDVHGLNDEFFSIDDFNRITEQQDAAGSDIGDDEIDLFAGTCFFLGSRQC